MDIRTKGDWAAVAVCAAIILLLVVLAITGPDSATTFARFHEMLRAHGVI